MNARQLMTQFAREKGISDRLIIGGHLHATEKIEKSEEAEDALSKELTEKEEQTYRRVMEIMWKQYQAIKKERH